MEGRNGERLKKELTPEGVLLVITAGGMAVDYPLGRFGKSRIRIGRNSGSNDIVLDSKVVSHDHGVLNIQGNRIQIGRAHV